MLSQLENNTRAALTDADGWYRIEAVEPGEYLLHVHHPAYESTFDDEVTVPAGESRRDVELGTSVIAGRVIDQNGEGVTGVSVLIAASDGGRASSYHRSLRGAHFAQNVAVLRTADVRTDPTGAWEIRGVKPGVALIALAGGGDSHWQPVCSEELTLAAGQRLDDVILVVQPGGSLVVRFSGSDGMRSKFHTAFHLTRGAGAQMEWVNGNIDGPTGRIDALVPGPRQLEIHVRHPRQHAIEREIRIVAGETTEVDILLPD